MKAKHWILMVVMGILLSLSLVACDTSSSQQDNSQGLPPGGEGGIVVPDDGGVELQPTQGIAEPRIDSPASDGTGLPSEGPTGDENQDGTDDGGNQTPVTPSPGS